MEDPMKLVIELKNSKPVELLDLSRSLGAIANEYRRFLTVNAPEASAADFRLYIKEVRAGSVIIELAAVAPYALPLIEHCNTVLEFAGWIRDLYYWLLRRGERPENVDGQVLHSLSQIVEPAVKDQGSQLNIGTVNLNGDIVINVGMDSKEAGYVQSQSRLEQEALREQGSGDHSQVVLHWAQARNRPNNGVGDRARIESISASDVRVRFENEELKRQMLYDPEHPFAIGFVVDVSVETINGRPVLYRVKRLHEVLAA